MNTVDPKEPYGDPTFTEGIPQVGGYVREIPPKDNVKYQSHLDVRTGDDNPTERAPLLSDEDVDGLWDRFGRCVDDKVGMRSTEVRDFYEAKITSGELRVVKKVSREQWRGGDCCGDSSGGATEWHGYPNFCPGCGAQIVE